MPTLKQLDCQIKWVGSNLPLREYHVSYGDGFVHSYVAVPPIATPFYVQLKSNGFIASGLAMFLYIDGEYQCNRNRCNLKDSTESAAKHQTEVDFVVRQKEKPLPGGHFATMQWQFRQDNVGIIEVVVLRCNQARKPKPRRHTVAALSTPSTVTSIELSSEDEESPESSIDKAQGSSDALSNLGALFDGNDEKLLSLGTRQPLGGDGQWDANTHQDALAGQDRSMPHAGPQSSPAIIINVNQSSPHAASTSSSHSMVSGAGHSGQGEPYTSSGLFMPGPQDSQSTWATDGKQSDNGEWDNGNNTAEAEWGSQGAQAEIPDQANHNDTASDLQSKPGGQGWGFENNHAQNDNVGQYDNVNQAQSGSGDNGHSNHSRPPNNAGYEDRQGQNNDAGWNSNAESQGNDHSSNNENNGMKVGLGTGAYHTVAHDTSQGSNGGSWVTEQAKVQVPGFTDSRNSQTNQAEPRSTPQQFLQHGDPSQLHSAGHSGQLPLPFVISSDRSHIKPYWATWDQPHAEQDMVLIEEDEISVDSDSTNSEGRVNLEIGKSLPCYMHKIGRPQYLDTHENPYAVFAFSYRSSDVIEKLLNVRAQESEEEERARLSVLSKDEILGHFMRAKSIAGSGLNSGISAWNRQSSAPVEVSNAPPVAGLGINLADVNSRLANVSAAEGQNTGRWNNGDHTEQQTWASANPGAQQWAGNGGSGNVDPRYQAGQDGEHSNPNINSGGSTTAGAQEPAAGGNGGTHWGSSQAWGGNGDAPMMSGALAPHMGNQQVNNGPNGRQMQGPDYSGGGGPGGSAPQGSPTANVW